MSDNTVIFDMWGQRCQTKFNDTSELEPLEWLDRLEEKGWLLPIEIRLENGTIIHNEEELKQILYR